MAIVDDENEGPATDARTEATQPRQARSLAPRRKAPSEVPVAGEQLGNIHIYIGSRLRQAFDDIASQPVPDRFVQLMRDLDKA